jgi:hypothetical protein
VSEDEGSRWSVIDREIFDGRPVHAVRAVRQEFGGGIHDAIDVVADRFALLRDERPGEFTVDVDSWGKGEGVYT